MKKFYQIGFIFFIVILFLFLRLYHLEDSLTVGTDQGMHLLEIYRLYNLRKISLIGPVSSFKVYGRNFFFGPAVYYLPMPFLVLSGWNPFAASYFTIFTQLITFSILYKILCRNYPESNIPRYFALIFTFSPIVVNYSRFLWNPNLTLQTSLLLLSVFLVWQRKKSKKNLWPVLSGFLLGIGLQFHYSYFLIILLTSIYLRFSKRLNLKNLFLLMIGFVSGFLPIVLFELRHNLYNLTTFIQFILVSLSKENNTLTYTPGYIPEYYILSFLPFIFFAATLLLEKMEKVNRLLPAVIIFAYLFYSSAKILPVPSHGFLTPAGWTYQGVNRAKEIIISENIKNFNIIDLLTGDTRAIYLRALLTLAGKPPMTVDEYPDSRFLFLYTKEPIEKILQGSLWEMDVIKPLAVRKKWHLQNGIYLYLLESIPKFKKNNLP